MSSKPTPPRPGVVLFVVALITGLSLAFTGSCAGALHDPTPHHVPIAVSSRLPPALVSHPDPNRAADRRTRRQRPRQPTIASTLYVTTKTVDWQLGNAKRKLDINSRRQLHEVLARRAGARSAGG